MTRDRLRIVILGLSITSSWGNGHATTYRALVKGLARRGHDVLFLERDVPWYASQRDLDRPPYGHTVLYDSLEDLERRHEGNVRDADLVIVGSYVPDGIAVGEWVLRVARGTRAFYDIDTPVTLALLERGASEYLTPALARRYDLYLSFTGGPTLDRLAREHGVERARPLYCSVDPELYRPTREEPRWDLGYLGTYAEDRHAGLCRLLLDPAKQWTQGRFIVAGPQYPETMAWPPNVERTHHVAPCDHARFYGRQRFTLNLTRAPMIEAGYSPSVRLFEAAACGTPIVSDRWAGLEEVLTPGREILIAEGSGDVLGMLRELPEARRREIGEAARDRVLRSHTGEHRADQLAGYVREVVPRGSSPAASPSAS
ncbi:MAG TPA: glycosyltransferase [Candidatus Eisenbacteria bacterium]|nr:glycosyltransferase [Candidatus Eisenbacteria bacterium]